MATAIIYWSGTGNTEAMANAIAAGMGEKGVTADVFSVSAVDANIVDKYDKIAFGCPSMGMEVLEENEFDPFFTSVEGKLSGKKVALFGSFGWGSGDWMRNWEKRTDLSGAILIGEGLLQQDAPDEDTCKEYGAKFAEF